MMIAQVDLLDLIAVALALFGIIMTAIISIGAILIDQLDKNWIFGSRSSMNSGLKDRSAPPRICARLLSDRNAN